MAKIQNTKTPYACKDVEQQVISFIVGENKNGTYTLEDSLVVSYKIKHTLTTQYSNHTPWYLLSHFNFSYLVHGNDFSINFKEWISASLPTVY